MIDGSRYKNEKIASIQEVIANQPLYSDLFEYLNIKNIEKEFMTAELLLEQIQIGEFYVKIIDPNVKLMDFFNSKGFALKTLLPALETESFKYNITAWLEKVKN